MRRVVNCTVAENLARWSSKAEWYTDMEQCVENPVISTARPVRSCWSLRPRTIFSMTGNQNSPLLSATLEKPVRLKAL